MVDFVRMSLLVLAAYGALGVFFALAFHLWGLHGIDAATRGTGIGFRLLITPGVVALWPLMTWLWWASQGVGSFPGGPDSPFPARQLRAAHALSWKVLAITIPLVVGAALGWRPREAASSRIPIPSPAPSIDSGVPSAEPRGVRADGTRQPGHF